MSLCTPGKERLVQSSRTGSWWLIAPKSARTISPTPSAPRCGTHLREVGPSPAAPFEAKLAEIIGALKVTLYARASQSEQRRVLTRIALMPRVTTCTKFVL